MTSIADLQTKTTSSASPLAFMAPDEGGEVTQSFAALLQGIVKEGQTKGDAKFISLLQDGLETSQEVKSDVREADFLTRFLQTSKSEETPMMTLDSEITAALTPKELKVLIQEAKQYLKKQIISLEGFQKEELKMLPKTLKGLVQVAKKLGIDVSKITIESLKANGKETKQSISLQNSLEVPDESKATTDTKQNLKKETLPKTVVTVEKNTDKEVHLPQKDSKQTVTVSEDEAALTRQIKRDESQTSSPKAETAKVEVQNLKEREVHEPRISGVKTAAKSVAVQHPQERPSEEVHSDAKQLQKESLKQTPLFVETSKTKTPQATTELFVHLPHRQNKNQTSTLKNEKRDRENTLELLLRGKAVAKQNTTLGADFSLESARVIPAGLKTENQTGTQNTLFEENSTQNQNSIQQSSLAPKAESLEVKLHEAKQMMRYLSHDVKQAIDDYKAPFTRVKVQLNPQNLGEIDLTVVQRGKNLHINLSSNNTAINTLALHVNDLKVQLQNSGIQNASLNFSNASGSEQGSANNSQAQQQQQNNHHNANEEYGYFEKELQQEEKSLEIVVPYYA